MKDMANTLKISQEQAFDTQKNLESYHHGNLKNLIVEEGLKLLEEKGSMNISVRELARQIGVSTGAAYRHFKNKNEFMITLAIHGCKSLLVLQMNAIDNEKTPEFNFTKIGRLYLDFAIKNPVLFQLIFGDITAKSSNPELIDIFDKIYKNLMEAVASVLRLPSDDYRVIIFSAQAWSLVHGMSVLILNGQFQRITHNIYELIDSIFKNQMILA